MKFIPHGYHSREGGPCKATRTYPLVENNRNRSGYHAPEDVTLYHAGVEVVAEFLQRIETSWLGWGGGAKDPSQKMTTCLFLLCAGKAHSSRMIFQSGSFQWLGGPGRSAAWALIPCHGSAATRVHLRKVTRSRWICLYE